ncbi:MAG: hypothetical protein JO034_13840, partial [Singulisphaera sp.]|nr:hypothetical protein [Singulisphaera sp.]
MPILTLQIFVSSPYDVEVERKRTGDVVKHLQEEFANYVKLRPFSWEENPLRATSTFQD